MGAVPFTIQRVDYELDDTIAITETLRGILRLEIDKLVIQWEKEREVADFEDDSLGLDSEVGPRREVSIPLHRLGGARVKRPWLFFWPAPKLVLTASDLEAFAALSGDQGIRLKHPAKIEFKLQRSDRLLAEELAAELELAVSKLPRGPGLDDPRLGPGE